MAHLSVVWRAYRRERWLVKAHIIGRVLMCRYRPLVASLPSSGTMLEVGCGYGILWHLVNDRVGQPGDRSFVGIDHAEPKIDVARRCATANMVFSNETLDALPDRTFDVVAFVDILCEVDLCTWPSMLAQACRVLKDEGRLILKEPIDRPRWKYWFMMLQETLAVKIFKFTKGDAPHFESIGTIRRALEAAGLAVERVENLSAWSHFNQCLFIARKAARPDTASSAVPSVMVSGGAP